MSKEASALLMAIKGVMFDMTEEQQVRVKEAKDKIDAILEEYGGEGLMALAWIGAERGGE